MSERDYLCVNYGRTLLASRWTMGAVLLRSVITDVQLATRYWQSLDGSSTPVCIQACVPMFGLNQRDGGLSVADAYLLLCEGHYQGTGCEKLPAVSR